MSESTFGADAYGAGPYGGAETVPDEVAVTITADRASFFAGAPAPAVTATKTKKKTKGKGPDGEGPPGHLKRAMDWLVKSLESWWQRAVSSVGFGSGSSAEFESRSRDTQQYGRT